MNNKGFTLIELSVVLILISLIVAGISVGSTLTRQANMRAVITEMTDYKRSYQAFKERYNAKPGDFAHAFTHWPTTVQCTTTGVAADCNGDGNGFISFANREQRKAWMHLRLAELTSYTPILIASADGVIISGTTIPFSKIDYAAYLIVGNNGTNTMYTGVTTMWPNSNTSAIYIGSTDSVAGDTRGGLSSAALSGAMAYQIDEKIDDGAVNASGYVGANTGMFRSFTAPTSGSACATGSVYTIGSFLTLSCVSGLQLD